MNKKSIYTKFFHYGNGIFLFNAFSRACLRIKDEEKANIEKLLEVKDRAEIIDTRHLQYYDILQANGYLVPQTIDEINRIKFLFNSNFFTADFLNIILEPTLSCNFKCPYCFEKGHAPIKESNHYVSTLLSFSEKYFPTKKSVRISLFGGEPLLRQSDFFFYFDEIFQDKAFSNIDLSTSITTNGYLLNDTIFSRLLSYNLKALQVSIDGNKKTHDSQRVLHNDGETYAIIVENLKDCLHIASERNHEMAFNLRVNLINQNVDDLKEVLSEFEPEIRGRINILLRPIFKTKEYSQENRNTINELKPFFDTVQEFGYRLLKGSYFLQHCESGGGANCFHITPDLGVWKCINDLSYEEAKIGTITEDGTLNIDTNRISNWYRDSQPFDGECNKCYYLPMCYGGCPLVRSKNEQKQCNPMEMTVIPYFYK